MSQVMTFNNVQQQVVNACAWRGTKSLNRKKDYGSTRTKQISFLKVILKQRSHYHIKNLWNTIVLILFHYITTYLSCLQPNETCLQIVT